MAKSIERKEFLKYAGLGMGGLALTGLFGCAPDDDVAVTNNDAEALVLKPVPDTPLKLGGQWILSGPLGTYGEFAMQGVNMAVDEINANGGVLGREIEFIVLDDEMGPDVGIRNARRLVMEDEVEAMIGTDSSGVALALKPVVEDELQVPWIVTHASTPRLTEGPGGHMKYTFRISTILSANKIAAARLINELDLPYQRIAHVSPDYAYGYDGWSVFRSEVGKLRPDIELGVAEAWAPFGTTDFTPHITTLLEAEPDLVFSTLWAGELVTFIRQALGFDFFEQTDFMVGMGASTDVLYALGDEAPEGIWASNRYWFQYPPWETWEINKKFNEDFTNRYGTHPAYVAETSYSAIYSIKAAIERHYTLTGGDYPNSDQLARALEGLAVATPGGIRYFRPGDHQATNNVTWGRYKHDPNYDIPILDPMYHFPAEEVTPEVGVITSAE